MSTAVTRARPFLLMSLVVAAFACSSNVGREPYYPYRYPFSYRGNGTYTVVRRPVEVVDKWTSSALESGRYHRYSVLRSQQPPITYTATRPGDTVQVTLRPMGDSTALQVRARNGQSQKREQARARTLMGDILKDYK